MSKLSKSDYEDELKKLQIELNRIANWVQKHNKRVLVHVEGRDTAGKGGVISALKSRMNGRWCRTVALGKASEQELGQWYFQRYLAHLPSAVEKVRGYCTEEQCAAFLKQTPIVENLLIDDGIIFFKYWLSVDQEKQEERFQERLTDPLKQSKLSPVDLLSREKYEAYTEARTEMFEATHIKKALWVEVDFNNQKLGRLNLIRHFIEQFLTDVIQIGQPELITLKVPAIKEMFSKKPNPIKSYY